MYAVLVCWINYCCCGQDSIIGLSIGLADFPVADCVGGGFRPIIGGGFIRCCCCCCWDLVELVELVELTVSCEHDGALVVLTVSCEHVGALVN